MMTIYPVYVNDVVPDMRDSEIKNGKRYRVYFVDDLKINPAPFSQRSFYSDPNYLFRVVFSDSVFQEQPDDD